jgi:hypothetical protein
MFSMPPAMAQSIMPAQISSAALATPWAPDPQTRLTLRAGTSTGSPAAMPAWRAGFIFTPAWITLPITRASILSAARPERFSVSRIAVVGRKAGTLQRLADRGGAKFRRGHVFQAAAIGADGGTHGVAKNDLAGCHVSSPWGWVDGRDSAVGGC